MTVRVQDVVVVMMKSMKMEREEGLRRIMMMMAMIWAEDDSL